MNITNINSITTTTYDFRVFDYSKRKTREEMNVRGDYLIGKICFSKNETPEEMDQHEKFLVTVIKSELTGTDAKIAETLNQVIAPFRNIKIDEQKYRLKSIDLMGSPLLSCPPTCYPAPFKTLLMLYGDKDVLSSEDVEALFGHIKNQANQS